MERAIIVYLTLQLIWCGFAMYNMKMELQNLTKEHMQALRKNKVD